MTPVISVVIPVKNGGECFARCLDGIRSQEIHDEVEIIVIDSGSVDGSVEAARHRGARVHQIPAHQFSHGASRNLGARLSSGQLLVFLSQDAIPVGSRWLANLTEPLGQDRMVAGVYGRQLPNADAIPPESYFLNFLYGPEPRRQTASSALELSMATTLFSNVNSAMSRSMWERFSFVEDIVMSEDQEWSCRVLLAGFAIAYEPTAAVRHSHNYSIGDAFRRFFDSGVSSRRAYMSGREQSSRVLRAAAARYATGELAWLWRTGQGRWIPYAALYESTKMLGLLAGVNHGRIPLPIKRRLSAAPYSLR
jgi:rhamnosyltransferase